ncbi:hypothetical protein BP5796_11148 [Coleophoma crateriformis]|uniref:Uncharacterized protein n=1 Tax=Coleophoma crateriformis TaxID=565419 RepID=A0A3D8QLY5_9HELO|nr:hypothetical protein BP5796_11148 [Coleophoma crateriformis]
MAAPIPKLLPSITLMARAFHRVPPSQCPLMIRSQPFSSTSSAAKWKGSESPEHVTNEGDSHNVQQDASKDGKQARAEGSENSAATSEKGTSAGEKAKSEHPNAPGPILGMEDERGGKSR